MISIRNAKKFCKEDISKIENYEEAITDDTQIWHCHHRDEVKVLPSGIIVHRSMKELIENGRYYKCPANELIFLTKSEHTRLHNIGRTISEELKIKIIKAMKARKGNITSEFGRKFNEHYGITLSDNAKLYRREHIWYRRHNNKCRWEEFQ